MDNGFETAFAFFVGVVVTAGLIGQCAYTAGKESSEAEAIKRGYGQIAVKDGTRDTEFRWIEPVKAPESPR